MTGRQSVKPKVMRRAGFIIGTGYNGHTFSSALVPFDAVAPGPDCSVQGWRTGM